MTNGFGMMNQENTPVIIEDRRLWKRNFKFGQLPGDLSIRAKEVIFNGEIHKLKSPYCELYSENTWKTFRKEVIKKANRKWRHEFKQSVVNPNDLDLY